MRRATEQVAKHAGPGIGGLRFGTIAEVLLALFVLASGDAAVVQAQIAGSIIGTSLFGLGLPILVGSITPQPQKFNAGKAGLLSTLLILAVVAMLLPAVFDYTGRLQGYAHDICITYEELSHSISVLLLLLYCGNLGYTMITHRDTFADEESHGVPSWRL
jgi:Ca2+:H+ antiporter